MSRNILRNLIGAWCPSLGPSGYTLLDRGGRGNHGTLTNMDAGTDWVGTPGGWALDFDGTNDYVDLGDKAVFFQANAFTISLWFKRVGTPASQFGGYMFSDYNSGGNTSSIAMKISGGQLGETANSIVCFWENAGFNRLTNAVAIDDQKWTHAVWTYNAGVQYLYLNGVEAATITTTQARADLVSSLAIGRPGSLNGLYFSGAIGDVLYLSTALAAPSVRELYRLGQSGLGRLLTPQRRSYAFRVPAAVKSYLFANRGQVIGGGTL